ncbi:hypothetical protein EG328_002978 [Venturia inaequalis]|uniref:Uncharacterized protein n=1 Tax=Venturia inaequalis TaxID=5025 RepID=A0A8H3UW13_VENIN|nr:hypothetical protein EG328_002978 [Venturia inaequalis]RDI79171.1 hypothetical protein Vi05172_g10866 [Venturia inaequalis]
MSAWQRLQPSGLRIFRDLRLTTPKYAQVLASGPVWQPPITKEPPADSQIATTMVARSEGYIAAKQLCAKARRSLTGVAHCDHDSPEVEYVELGSGKLPPERHIHKRAAHLDIHDDGKELLQDGRRAMQLRPRNQATSVRLGPQHHETTTMTDCVGIKGWTMRGP